MYISVYFYRFWGVSDAGSYHCQKIVVLRTTQLNMARVLAENSFLFLFLMCTCTSTRQKLSNTGYIKGEASRLLRTQSSKTTFEENINLFKQRLRYRGYLNNLIDKTLSEVNFRERMSSLQNKQKTRKTILPFVTEYRPSVPNLKPFR